MAKADAQKLASLRAQGKAEVGMAVASRSGGNAATAAAVKGLGGVVRFRADEFDYLNAVVPLEAAVRFTRAASIVAVTIDEMPSYGWPQATMHAGTLGPVATEPTVQAAAPAGDAPWPPALSPRPLEKRYPFLEDLDAHGYRTEHPGYDGRGVVIAHVERAPDFLSPELQTALDLHGREIRKFADVVSSPALEVTLDADPARVGSNGWQWVRLSARLPARNGQVSSGNVRCTVPGDAGQFRLGEIRIPIRYLRAIAYMTGEKDTGAVPFAVLWSDETRTVWLDTDRDHDFADETPVAEFWHSGRFGVLGRDDPATQRRESLGFAVQREGPFVALNFGVSDHATMVAGDAAARAGDRGRIDGVAPGAQLLSVSYDDTISTWGPALITAFSDARVDVVLVEIQYPVLGLYHLKDGRSTVEILLQRLIERFGKPCLITADNDTGLGSVIDTTPMDALVIGASQTRGATLAHRGLMMRLEHGLHWVGGEGPTGRGDLKPDALAPVNDLTLAPRFLDGATHEPLFRLPPGYQIGAGTSSATPVAAGAVALLISGAKQTGLRHDAVAINRAMRDSARFLPGIEAYQQGAGVVRVGAAWERLQTESREGAPWRIETRAPVHTATSALLWPADTGVGLFEREGWRVGGSGERAIYLTRRNGGVEPVSFALAWQGNGAGVFATAAHVTLLRDTATPVPIKIVAPRPGAFSATLELRHPSRAGAVHRVPCTIVVPHELNETNGFVLENEVRLDRPGRQNVFVRVPAGTQALLIELQHGRGEWAYGRIYSPDNQPFPSALLMPERRTGRAAVAIAAPVPGVWQVALNESSDAMEFDVATAHAVPPPSELMLRTGVVAVELDHDSTSARLTVRNRQGPLEAAVPRNALGAARRIAGRLARGEQRVFDLQVEEGTEILMAQVEGLGDGPCDVDLYLFDCTRGHCRSDPARRSHSHASNARVLMDDPPAGSWRVVVDAIPARDAVCAFRYLDVVAHPKYGALVTDDAVKRRSTGEQWQVSTKFWRAAPVESGRTLAALMHVKDDGLLSLHPPRAAPSAHARFPYAGDADSVPLGLLVIDVSRAGAVAGASVWENRPGAKGRAQGRRAAQSTTTTIPLRRPPADGP